MDLLLPEALSRTLLLMRDEVTSEAKETALISALTNTNVVLVGDARNLESHAAQSAFITAALLMGRSGHQVHLLAPDVTLRGLQPPLKGDRLMSALLSISQDLLPGVGFSVFPPRDEAALQVVIGNSSPRARAQHTIAINAHAWSGLIDTPDRAIPWMEPDWPVGAMAAGAIAAAEAFKAAMHHLRPWARNPARFHELFRFVTRVLFELAPAGSAQGGSLGDFDFISGGAITNNALYALARIPGVTGHGRIIEPETGEITNLNRYMLMLMSDVDIHKGRMLQSKMRPELSLETIPLRFTSDDLQQIGGLSSRVLVGVDDIPSRWQVQAHHPTWLGIGATTHWEAMASYHAQGLGCARCLHPRDDPTVGVIPTVSFVSFFGGLTLATYMLRAVGAGQLSLDQQCSYFSPLRPEFVWRTPVAIRPQCPTCMGLCGARAA